MKLFGWIFSCASAAAASTPAVPTTVFRHKWDTVADAMGMHGKVQFGKGEYPSDESLAFVANNYAMATTGGGCGKSLKGSLEDTNLNMVAQIKAHNPDILTGMYWRTDMAIEIADCTNGTAEWNAHPEWHLKDDKGQDVLKNGNIMLDYSNKQVYAFFQNLLLNVLKSKLPSGKPVMNYLYLDGPGGNPEAFAPGIGPKRSEQLLGAKFAFMSDLQMHANALGQGQNVILNGVDTADTAQSFATTGVAGVMIDHWSILQFVQRGKAAQEAGTEGKFNVTLMDELFKTVRSQALSNMTLHIKGWVGPIVKQRDHYPSNIPSPKTPADFQRVAGERFNSELALFLLVAEDTMYWMYSWFWGFDDYVPNQPDSSVPTDFFPQAKCALGAPRGPPARAPGTFTYTREYEHASVFVDLQNRTASRVDFKNCPSTIAV